jgi:antitoxin (DNA-binding transcriptional repressor) of toxin-antitoxin stability system
VSRTIEQRELRNDNAKVIEALTAGETFVVTRNGEPVAELRPLQLGRRRFMSREELAVLARTLARADRDQLRADLDDVSTTNAEPHSMTGARHRI